MSAATKVREAVAPAPRAWRSCRELVDVILSRATEPIVSLSLGGTELVKLRPGGIALLIGGTGRGKTSLACSLLVEHARNHGPALAVSLELPADELVARMIGTRCDASWLGVLSGELKREVMTAALPERLAVLDREHATIDALAQSLGELRATNPNEPILVAVDYVQLVELEEEREIRHRVGRVMRKLDEIARLHRVAVIALSQGTRASSRTLNDGSRIGSDTTDAGAESSDLERWASVTLAIGAHGSEAEDGSCAAEISIGKSRMGGGDRVVPCRYSGRSGLWRITGESRSAMEVRAERQGERDGLKREMVEAAIAQRAGKSSRPLTREDLRTGFGRGIATAAIDALIARGELVKVRQKKQRASAWMIWTRANAVEAGVAIEEATP